MNIETGSSRDTWLDLFPSDICIRIAAHLGHGQQCGDALHLAESSPKQRVAVMEALSHKVVILRSHEDEVIARWAKVSTPTVKKVVVFDRVKANLASVADLVTAPNVQEVFIPDNPVLLKALSLSSSVKQLQISVRQALSRELLFDSLSKLSLSKLEFACAKEEGDVCLFKDSNFFNQNYNALVASCPRLRSLRIVCSCNVWAPEDPTWRIFPTLSGLRELQFEGYPPVSAISQLQAFEAVEIDNGLRSHEIAGMIGKAVTSLSAWDCCLEPDQITELVKCPQLRTLFLTIAKGAEMALAALVRRLPSLSSLTVLLEPCDHELGPCDHWGSGRKGELPAFGGPYHYPEVQQSVMLRMIETAPLLRELSITEMRISLQELKAILERMGERLQRFSTSVADQDEWGLERLEGVLLGLASYNAELRFFTVTELRNLNLRAKVVSVANNAQAMQYKQRLFIAIQRLRVRAPYWNSEKMVTFFDRAFASNTE